MKINVKDIICLGVNRPDSSNNSGFIDKWVSLHNRTSFRTLSDLEMVIITFLFVPFRFRYTFELYLTSDKLIQFTWNISLCVACNMLFPTLLVSLRKIFFLRFCGKHALFFPKMTIQAIGLTGQISSSMCLCLTGIFPTWKYVSTQLIFYHRLFWWKEEHKGKEEECKLRISLSE